MKTIAIYGTGKIAKKYIQEHKSENIVGCMDRVFETGEVCQIPILSFEQVIKAGVDTIVIAAAAKHVKVIYDRIFHRCMLHNISICNAGGYDLVTYYGVPSLDTNNLSKLSEKEALELINSHDIISFDVFDTLIMRTTLEPRDIFDCVQIILDKKGIVCPNYKYNRIVAEHMSFGKDIYEIYRHFREITGLDTEVVQIIMQEEIICEKKHIIPRTHMVELMQHALNLGKIVNLVSDMYLPENILSEILKDIGIVGYHKLFVSCDCGCTKETGLFDVYKKQFGEQAFLHIGDVDTIDIIPAKKSGIDAYRIYSAKDMLCISDVRMLYDLADTFNERKLIGQIIAEIFNNPFVFRDGQSKLAIRSLYNYGALLAPLVIQYMLKLNTLLSEHTYDGVLFLARDGYLFKKVYDKTNLSKKVLSHYLLSSRKMSIRSGVQNMDELQSSKRYLRGYFENPIQELYGVEVEKNKEQSWDDMIDVHAEEIIAHSHNSLTGYKKWMKENGIDISKSYLLCELNGYGTSHYYIEKIFETHIDAMYLVRNHGEYEYKLNCNAVWEFEDRRQSVSSLIINNPLMEIIFTSKEPSAIDMTENGEPVYAEEKRSVEELDIVQKIQDGIEHFSVTYLNDYYKDDSSIKKELAEQALKFAAMCSLEGECAPLKQIVFSNDVGNIKQNLFTGEII